MSVLTADAAPPPVVATPDADAAVNAEPSAAATTAAHVVLLKNIPWETYEALADAEPSRSAPRIAYDNGTLEVMGPLRRHERKNRLIVTIFEEIADIWNIDIESAGSVTLRRSDLLKGLEPDTCYYIQNYDAVFGKDTLDLEDGVDPPPDLVIEVDETSPSLAKMPILAALGVPEVWIATASGVTFFGLQNGQYEEREESVALPPLTRAVVEDFLAQSLTVRRVAWMRAVQTWARDAKPATTWGGGTITA